MATTSARLLTLLSLLGAQALWSGVDLAERLSVSSRTLRRGVDALRGLGYPVETVKGPDGGYRLGATGRLPPLLLDDDQALAVAIALQTAPLGVTAVRNAWELPGGDVARHDVPARWQCLGSAVLALPADVVARWAPGGTVVERVGPQRTRLTLGACSLTGIAGQLATFDADVEYVQPERLRQACATVARRDEHASR